MVGMILDAEGAHTGGARGRRGEVKEEGEGAEEVVLVFPMRRVGGCRCDEQLPNVRSKGCRGVGGCRCITEVAERCAALSSLFSWSGSAN